MCNCCNFASNNDDWMEWNKIVSFMAFVVFGATDPPPWTMASSFTRFRGHSQSRQDSPGRVISLSQRPLPNNTQHSQQTDIHAPDGIRNHNLSRQAAADLHLRPRGYWGRQLNGSAGKAVPLQAWSDPKVSRKLRFTDFVTTAQDGGKVVSLTHLPPLPPGNIPGTHFC